MEKDKEIKTLSVEAGNHTYYIDVKSSTDYGKYILFSESRRMPEGYYDRHKIIITEEAVRKVLAALEAALEHFPITDINSMQTLKKKFPNAFKPWTPEEDRKLERLFCEGKKQEELSSFFQRNIGAINARIEQLGLRLKYS